MRHKFSLALATACAIVPLGSAIAQIAESGYSLPLTIAQKAATSAIASCDSSGYPVSAVVVDASGVIKVEARGDHATVHTPTSAYRKAYTVVTFGPIFRFDASSAFASLAAKNPNGAALATLPDIAPLAGGVAIKVGDEIVAALGVSGSPGGDKDEVCAQAGVASIQADLANSLARGSDPYRRGVHWLVAQTTISQRERMTRCNKQAGDQKLTGDARKTFTSNCLSGETTTEKPLTAEQQRTKECNAIANSRDLKGDERKDFMSTCLVPD